MAHNVLQRLVSNSQAAIDDGTYDTGQYVDGRLQSSGRDLAHEIRTAPHAALVTEIKFSSPSEGKLRTVSDPASIAGHMVRGGARGLSVLTQPHLFGGSPEYFARVRQAVTDVPMLMKDIVIDTRQVDAAVRIGADYILLIEAVLGDDEGRSPAKRTTADMISYAHGAGLGVLLEVHTPEEYGRALGMDADIIGVNNRNLDTLEVDIGTTQKILGGRKSETAPDRIVISESGITSPRDIRALRTSGADGFLIGSHIMKISGSDMEKAVRELVNAY